MAATTSGYGAYNPAAVDPYPIETDLAKLAVGNSPENAANLLDLYQLQRTTDAANYGHEMGIQHDFARQQLAQQLKETYLKNAMDAVKTRGGLSVYNQLAPEAQITPDVAGPIETGLSNAQDAATAEKAGSAAYHGVQAGTPPNMDVLRRVSGGMFDTAGIPLQLQVQAARNAGKGGGKGGSAQGNIASEGFDYTDEFGVKNHYGISRKATPEQIRDFKTNVLGMKPIDQPMANPALPPEAGKTQRQTTPQTQTASAPGPGKVPGLPANPNRVSGRSTPSNEAAGARLMQDRFIAAASNPAVQKMPGYAQIIEGAKKNGGRPQVRNGRFVGADGNLY